MTREQYVEKVMKAYIFFKSYRYLCFSNMNLMTFRNLEGKYPEQDRGGREREATEATARVSRILLL